MRRLLDTWRRQRLERPAASRLAMLGVGAVALGAALAVAGLALLAQLVAGLALVPLSLAAALCLLPAQLWPDGGDGGGGTGPGDDRGGPSPAGGPDGEIDWDRFERELAQYTEQQRVARV